MKGVQAVTRSDSLVLASYQGSSYEKNVIGENI